MINTGMTTSTGLGIGAGIFGVLGICAIYSEAKDLIEYSKIKKDAQKLRKED